MSRFNKQSFLKEIEESKTIMKRRFIKSFVFFVSIGEMTEQTIQRLFERRTLFKFMEVRNGKTDLMGDFKSDHDYVNFGLK